MELVSKHNSNKSSILYWILDHKHFLLFSFFTELELEETLAWVSERFNQKVMSILLWREMMGQISGCIAGDQLENETLAVTEDQGENSDLEKEKLESLMQSCQIIDREEEKDMQEELCRLEREKDREKVSYEELETPIEEQVIKYNEVTKVKQKARKKFLAEFSLPGEHQWIDLAKIPKILLMTPEKGSAFAVKEMKSWIERIKASFVKIQSNTPESNPVAEIHYWRDVSSILDAMQLELNDKKTAQIVSKMIEWNCDRATLREFNDYKQQVLSGALEAKTNYDLLKNIELPFITLTAPTGLTNAPLLFPTISNVLQALYHKSTFYKESRLISLFEKIVNEILKVVEEQIALKELFQALYESKGRAKKVGIRLAQAHMIIDIISKNLFIKEWLDVKPKMKSSDEDISYLKFSRPDTAYIHDPLGQKFSSSKYVEMTNKNLPPHLKMQERLAITSTKTMWFERAQMLINTLVYVKKAATNIEAMCGTFAKACEFFAGVDPKLKLYGETKEFLDMYREYELPYEIFELTSAEAFESFVETYKGRAEEVVKKLDKAKRESQKKYKVKKIVHKTPVVPEVETTILPPPKYVIK